MLGAGLLIDLLQALASERAFFGHEAADRERRSRERSTCLAWRVFICISRQKWGVEWLAVGVSGLIASPWLQWRNVHADSTPHKSTVCVCVSPSSKEQICLLQCMCESCLKQWFRWFRFRWRKMSLGNCWGSSRDSQILLNILQLFFWAIVSYGRCSIATGI